MASQKVTVELIKTKLRSYGLVQTGRKEVLIVRLTEHLMSVKMGDLQKSCPSVIIQPKVKADLVELMVAQPEFYLSDTENSASSEETKMSSSSSDESDDDDEMKITVKVIRTKLKSFGQLVSGTKGVITQRLREYLEKRPMVELQKLCPSVIVQSKVKTELIELMIECPQFYKV